MTHQAMSWLWIALVVLLAISLIVGHRVF